jgi:Mrp family chromosome partitioning ATPase/Skp family chaperone for outer membrane proteins
MRQTDMALYEPVPTYVDEPWGQSQAPTGQSLWRLVDDRLRGRWRHMFLVGLLLSVGLGIAGFKSTVPVYRSVGAVRVTQYIIPTLAASPETRDMPGFQRFLETQVDFLRSRPILEDAARTEEVRALGWGTTEETIEAIEEGLGVRSARNSELITVVFEAEKPEAAQVAVGAIIRAYYERYGKVGGEAVGRNLETLEEERENKQRELRALRAEMTRLLSTYESDDLRALQARKLEEIDELERQALQFEQALEAMAARGDETVDPGQAVLEDLHPRLKEIRFTRDRALTEFNFVKERYKEGTAQYVRAEKRSETAQMLFEQEYQIGLQMFDDQVATALPGQLEGLPYGLPPERIAQEIEAIGMDVENLRSESQQITVDIQILADKQFEERRLLDKMEGIRTRIDTLRLDEDKLRKGRITVAHEGFLPSSPASDGRVRRTAAGLGFGFCLSFGLFFLLGSVDRRAFGAEQIAPTADASTPGCLGVLPDLGRSLSDPESSDVAAHCVHQIRNQIEAMRRPGEGYVLAITSPHQGDGKTSIVMALGWSYAAAGYKTLLVDCDLVGRALTRQLGMVGRDGLKEAIRSPQANGQVAPLHVEHLSVLPVGVDARFGPETVRRLDLERLFEAIRREYEVVIVDTGPLLGALESTPVVAAADGVVLSVRRGRSRTRLEECVSRLGGLGARYLGVILNCATRNDCDRYVSEASLTAAEQARTAAEEETRQSLLQASKDEQNALMLAMEGVTRGRSDDSDAGA